MNVRVLLLVLMTGFFMTLWDGDQAAMQAALARKSQRSATMLADARLIGAASQSGSKTIQTVQTVSETTRSLIDGQDYSACLQGNSEQVECSSLVASKNSVESLIATTVVASAVVPMPVGLPAGEYQAVSESGETLRMTISQNSESSVGFAAEQGLVMSTTPEGIKWYFIRIQGQAGK